MSRRWNRSWRVWTAAAVVVAGTAAHGAPTWTEGARLQASDAVSNDYFGRSVAVSGDTAVVGGGAAPSNAGAAYVLTRSGADWTQQAKLVASDPSSSAHFGSSAAISGGTIVVGAYGATGGGGAYVFTGSGATWAQQTKLLSPADGGFGVSVALSGDTAVVGANAETSSQGAAYVYTRSGATWTQQSRLVASDAAANDQFGLTVAVFGDTCFVGAPTADSAPGANDDRGAVYVFTRSGPTWTQRAKLTPDVTVARAKFGLSLSTDGVGLLVAAPYEDVWNGAAYVFTGAADVWTQQARLTPADPNHDSLFGYGVALDGGRAYVGKPLAGPGPHGGEGILYVFARTGTTWAQQAKILSSEPITDGQMGGSVASTGDGAMVGVAAAYPNGSPGAVWTFTTDGSATSPAEQYMLPSKVTVTPNAGKPEKSKLTASGTLNSALVDPDFTQPMTLTVGGLSIDVPGMTAVGGGKSFAYSGLGLVLKIVPDKKGSSKAKFSLVRTGDLGTFVPTDGTLALRLAGGGLDAGVTVTLAKGKYGSGKVPGALGEPPFFLSSLAATLKGDGLDALKLTAGFASPGTAPDAAQDFSLTVGSLDVSIPAASFTASGEKWSFKGDVSGVTGVVVDYAKGTVTVKAKKTSLGAFAGGVIDLTVTLGLDADSADMHVQAVHAGTSLKY